ncbi:uncharacterized protein LOC131658573 [Vicia villosa]|uniref:uncharacterized protein LOC131658573 n=1 Tax=Vicia villosa TaxID=3911 RepID=UPI00273ABB56|nr:uncharacterized protein LOC131658573 [Vicia villosa]
MEKGETSNSKQRRKREESWNPRSSWENYENETMNQRGYAKASGKWTKVAEEFKPYYDENKSKRLLNLDCVRNPEDILQRWSNDMIMLIATDEQFSKINLKDVKNLIAYRTTGNVLKFLTSINDETWNQYIGMVENNNQQFAKLIMELIYKEFIGYNTLEHKTEVNKILREKAEIHLINMQMVTEIEVPHHFEKDVALQMATKASATSDMEVTSSVGTNGLVAVEGAYPWEEAEEVHRITHEDKHNFR